MTTPDTGYDGGQEEEEPIIQFELVKTGFLYTGQGVTATLRRNGKNIGLVYLKSELELEWLKKRIDGGLDTESEIQQLKITGEET